MRDEGLLKFYSLTNTAPNGAKPVEKLVDLQIKAFYANRQIGVTRLYAAKGANARLDKLVLVYNTIVPEAAKYVILEDGRQYLISDAVQMVDSDAIELSLVRLETYYEVVE